MSPAHVDALLDNSSGILLLVDASSLAIVEVSNPTLRLLGYRREDLLGRPITDIECSLADAYFWEEVLKGNPSGAKHAEGSYRCANGGILPATKNVSRVTSGGKGWMVVCAEPLDSGPRIENQLASVASLLRATLEATADGILLIDRAGRIVNMNHRFARMWSLPDALLLEHEDKAVLGFMAARFANANDYRARLADIVLDGDGETFDLLQLADGRIFERKSTPAHQGAQIFGRVFSFTDITERKRTEAAHAALESQLREAQKMQAIGTLAGGIAHDFNNILATILGNAELARQDVSANPMALESPRRNPQGRLARPRLGSSDPLLQPPAAHARKPIALGPVIEESVRLLRATLPARLVLDVHCEADIPPVLADATQIQQVVINLATNAMQAINNRPGRIGIRLETVMLDAAMAEARPPLRALHERCPGRMVRLAISDDGPGMDAVTLSRIFQPFFTTKAVNEGTGLGLSVVHGIVQTHDGAIVVDSKPGWGSTFTVYLPVADSLVTVPAPDKGNSIAAITDSVRDRRILYLDDDESLVFLVTRLLERRGFRVSGYTDQREALAALRAEPSAFDLVVTDYNMPGMSGLGCGARGTHHSRGPASGDRVGIHRRDVAIASGRRGRARTDLQSQCGGRAMRGVCTAGAIGWESTPEFLKSEFVTTVLYPFVSGYVLRRNYLLDSVKFRRTVISACMLLALGFLPCE
ncbi:MAG: PAS domain S-box protein [Betaproteobacteria bacterium]|nr:PAS domain S-box protein [Betaproteobacteria bacterium]